MNSRQFTEELALAQGLALDVAGEIEADLAAVDDEHALADFATPEQGLPGGNLAARAHRAKRTHLGSGKPTDPGFIGQIVGYAP